MSHTQKTPAQNRPNQAGIILLILALLLLFVGVLGVRSLPSTEKPSVAQPVAVKMVSAEPAPVVKVTPVVETETVPIFPKEVVRDQKFEEMERRLLELQITNEKFRVQQERWQTEMTRQLTTATQELRKPVVETKTVVKEEVTEEKPVKKAPSVKPLPVQEEVDEFVEVDRIARGERPATPAKAAPQKAVTKVGQEGRSSWSPAPVAPALPNPTMTFAQGGYRKRPLLLQSPKFEADCKKVEELMPQLYAHMEDGTVQQTEANELDLAAGRIRWRLQSMLRERLIPANMDYIDALQYVARVESSRQWFVRPETYIDPTYVSEPLVSATPTTQTYSTTTQRRDFETRSVPTTTTRTVTFPTTTTRTVTVPTTTYVPQVEYYWVYE